MTRLEAPAKLSISETDMSGKATVKSIVENLKKIYGSPEKVLC